MHGAVNYGVLMLQALLANWIPSVRSEIGIGLSRFTKLEVVTHKVII